jgi:hypothetical protein
MRETHGGFGALVIFVSFVFQRGRPAVIAVGVGICFSPLRGLLIIRHPVGAAGRWRQRRP